MQSTPLAPASASESTGEVETLESVFSKLFGFKKHYSTFEEAYAASEDPENFIDNEIGFWKYKELFGNAFANESMFDTFQHNFLYHFLSAHQLAPPGQPTEEEVEALAIDEVIARSLIQLEDTTTGYAPGTTAPGQVTRNQARHTLMLTMLLHTIGSLENMSVAEVGGASGASRPSWPSR